MPLSSSIKAYKILDAPRLIIDHRINIMDVYNGVITIALSEELYFMNTQTNENGLIYTSSNYDYVSAVAWSDDGSNLCCATKSGNVALYYYNGN